MKTFLIGLLFMAQLSARVFLEPHADFKPRLDVAAVYIEYEDQILLLHRQNHVSQGNKWGIPGGKVEKNESPREAVIREVREETGLDISKNSIETLKPVYIEYSEKNHFVYHAFRTRFVGDPASVKIDFKEHKGFTWVTPSDALKMDLLMDEDTCIQKDYFTETKVP